MYSRELGMNEMCQLIRLLQYLLRARGQELVLRPESPQNADREHACAQRTNDVVQPVAHHDGICRREARRGQRMTHESALSARRPSSSLP